MADAMTYLKLLWKLKIKERINKENKIKYHILVDNPARCCEISEYLFT
jgi:hypothetical protein